ncbi:hypothetical protein ES705_28577 [subsurface metagenome]
MFFYQKNICNIAVDFILKNSSELSPDSYSGNFTEGNFSGSYKLLVNLG